MAEIAVALQQALAQRARDGSAGGTTPRVLARGEGWTVADVVCTSGPRDRTFEERHSQVSIAIVLAGSFQYRSAQGRAMLTPGSAMLGNPGQCFECGHEHANGDRCIAFWYTPSYFERLAADAGARKMTFMTSRVPPVGGLSSLVAESAVRLLRDSTDWEELSLRVAARSIQLAGDIGRTPPTLPVDAARRVTHAVRVMEAHPTAALTLGRLAKAAGLSPYHFLRTFERLTGAPPHQYLRRARLRDAAVRLSTGTDKVVDVALDCGFGDVSNFTRAFRAEFGESPRQYRRRVHGS